MLEVCPHYRLGLRRIQTIGVPTVLKWALVFFLVSLVAGIFGFTGIAAGTALIAKILFFLALFLFVLFLVLGLTIFKTIT